MNAVISRKRQRIMRSLKITELSGVDRPARQGARVLMMKRAGADPDPGSLAKGFVVLSEPTNGHAHLLQLTDAGGETWPSSMPGHEAHFHPWIVRSDGQTVIGMAAGHTQSVDRDEAKASLERLFKAASGAVAGDVLGIPETLPQALRGLANEPELRGPDASADELRAIRERNERRRDRAERESRQAEVSPPRTLRDIDVALESMAQDSAREGETMEVAFARLMTSRDPKFQDLLEERERLAISGVG